MDFLEKVQADTNEYSTSLATVGNEKKKKKSGRKAIDEKGNKVLIR